MNLYKCNCVVDDKKCNWITWNKSWENNFIINIIIFCACNLLHLLCFSCSSFNFKKCHSFSINILDRWESMKIQQICKLCPNVSLNQAGWEIIRYDPVEILIWIKIFIEIRLNACYLMRNSIMLKFQLTPTIVLKSRMKVINYIK